MVFSCHPRTLFEVEKIDTVRDRKVSEIYLV